MPNGDALLRILMVTDAYPPLMGGSPRQTQLLSQGLARRGHHVVVAAASHPGLLPEQDDGGVRVCRIKPLTAHLPWLSADPARRRYHPPLPDPMAVWQLRRLIYQVEPHILHAYGWITYSAAVALLGTRVPLVVSARDYSYVCPTRNLVRRTPGGDESCDGAMLAKCLACSSRVYRSPAKAAAAVVGVLGGRALLRSRMRGLHSLSTFLNGLMERHLLGTPTQRRAAVVHEVIPGFRADEDDGAPDPQILESLPCDPFVLFVGALRPIKGLGVLLAAFARLVSPPPPLVLLGTRYPDTPKSFPPGVTVLYDVPHPTVMAAWDRALFGLAPSFWREPFGCVVHEAMSRGRAMIGTVPSGMSDMIVDGESGLLVPAGDTDALRQAMQRLIDDAPFRERLGRAARTSAGRFTADLAIPQFEELYRRVLTGNSSQ